MATAARQLLTAVATLVAIMGICLTMSTSDSMAWNWFGLVLVWVGGVVICKLRRKS